MNTGWNNGCKQRAWMTGWRTELGVPSAERVSARRRRGRSWRRGAKGVAKGQNVFYTKQKSGRARQETYSRQTFFYPRNLKTKRALDCGRAGAASTTLERDGRSTARSRRPERRVSGWAGAAAEMAWQGLRARHCAGTKCFGWTFPATA